jgi:hypothetical protein
MIKGNFCIYIYKYEKISLLIDEKAGTKNILLSIVFAQHNTHVPNYTLNTTHLPASNTTETNHITSTAHCSQLQRMDRYKNAG